MRPMKLSAAILTITCFFAAGCANTDTGSRVKTDADDAAFKAGKIAHEAADKTEKAAKIAGEKIKEAAKSAKDGWKDSPSK